MTHPSLAADFTPYGAPLGGSIDRILAWDFNAMKRAGEDTITRFNAAGAQIPRQNRIQASVKQLERTRSKPFQIGPGYDSNEELLAECHRTLFEMHVIASNLDSNDDSRTLRDIAVMAGGPVLPSKDTFDRSRDIQAEQLARSLFRAAGYRVDMAEPDLVLYRSGSPNLGVAVKRVTGDAQYQKRVGKAEDQLEMHNLDGFIVVNAQRFLTDAYFADRSVDLSAALFRKVSSWVRFLRPQRQLRVLAVVGIGTSFPFSTSREGDATGCLLHFHSMYVAESDDDSRLQGVHAAASSMGIAMQSSLRAVLSNASHSAAAV